MKLAGEDLILVLGVHGRTGTHYMENLLALHPEVAAAAVPEDFVLGHADRLQEYVQGVFSHWPLLERGTDRYRLWSELGQALARFLRGSSEAPTIVSRTPRIDGVEHISNVLPGARLLIMVRDGRDVVESGRRSFGWEMVESTHVWANAVEKILRFRDEQQHPMALVRYERLLADPHKAMRVLLDFVELRAEVYPFDKIDSLPVRGSCETVNETGRPHWKPMPKVKGFNPVGRWRQTWTTEDHATFVEIAGEQMHAMGYEL